MGQAATATGPDFGTGIALAELPASGTLAGHVEGTPVLLSRLGGEWHAVSGTCSHYGAPLAEGLVEGDTVRCPWHHACFSLRTGEALEAPAFAPLARWRVEVASDRLFVRAATDEARAQPVHAPRPGAPKRIVLVGGGAAAFACAERLRRRGFDGTLTLLSADDAAPCDRPNLSKDFLAGTAPEDWIPLQDPRFYPDHAIDLRLNCQVERLDIDAQRVVTRDGDAFDYDALLLATGAEPVRPPLPGFGGANVFTLRSLSDARALIGGIAHASAVAVVGAGFIGMEAAAALRSRGLEVHVVAPEALPLARLLGDELGAYLIGLHCAQGVEFHLERRAVAFDGDGLLLTGGSRIRADAVLVGIGVKPRTALATAAGLRVDDGILVDSQLRTSAPGIFAAGDVARYETAAGRTRIEHWVHAQRQGQAAADNMLGDARAFADPPFFWTHHYGTELRYVGNGHRWNEAKIEGSPEAGDCLVRYFRNGALIAAAAIGRDRELLVTRNLL